MFRFLTALALACAVTVGGAHAQDDLPVEVRFDILRLEFDNAVREGRHREVLARAEAMRKLGQPLPPEMPFFEARAFHALGAHAMAQRSLTAYLRSTGREGANYQEAIRLYVGIKSALDSKTRSDAAQGRLRAAWEAAHAAWRDDRAEIEAWKKLAVVFGGPGEDGAAGLAYGVDGGVVVAGSFHLRADQEGRAVNATLPWITAFDAAGRRIWHRPLGSAADTGGLRSVMAVPGRGFLFGGAQKGFQIVAMTDPLGNVLPTGGGDPWVIAFAQAPGNEGAIARLLPDGDILALGAEELGRDERTGRAAARLPIAVRLAPDGSPRGKTMFGRAAGTLWFDVKDALVLADGDVIITGETRRDADATTAEGYMLRIGGDGRELWLRRLASRDATGMALTALAPYGDGGVIAVGRDGKAETWLAVDAAGDVLWQRHGSVEKAPLEDMRPLCEGKAPRGALESAYKNDDGEAAVAVRRDLGAVMAYACGRGQPFSAATAVAPGADGNYVVIGLAGREGEPSTRITLTAIDGTGDVLWRRRHGDDGASLGAAALSAADGGLIVAGVTTSWGRDVVLFRADAQGRLQSFAGLVPPPGLVEKGDEKKTTATETKALPESARTSDDTADTEEERYDLLKALGDLFGTSSDRSDGKRPSSDHRSR